MMNGKLVDFGMLLGKKAIEVNEAIQDVLDAFEVVDIDGDALEFLRGKYRRAAAFGNSGKHG